LIEDGFPNRRSVDEPGGEEEERRIFYVAVSRAMNELTLTYPLCLPRSARGPTVLTTPSRFLDELDESLLERGEIELEMEVDPLATWSGFANRPRP
jgi:DNA helicase-2/ATP-dependent DNA helicase PcrA